MEKVTILETKYLELVNHIENTSKFYRMTKLANGQWLQQNGRIGSEGAKRVFGVSNYTDKLLEKLDKGYEEKNDPQPQYIEIGLNHHDLTTDNTTTNFSNPPVSSPEPTPVDKNLLKSILERIDKIVKVVNDDLNELGKVLEIREQVKNTHIFTPKDIDYLNDLYNKYEEATV